MKKITKSDVLPVKHSLARAQKYTCPLCEVDLMKMKPENWCLDHNHDTGVVRGVLCRSCNGVEGRVRHWVRMASGDPPMWLQKLVDYLKATADGAPGIAGKLLHPTHRTEDEKRLAANKKRRVAAAKRKVPKA